MNRQFSFEATSAVARQLIYVSKTFGIVLDDNTFELAQRDTVVVKAEDLKPYQSHIQQLVDYLFRCIVHESSFYKGREVILAAAQIAGIKQITIVTPKSRPIWEPLIDAMGLSHGRDVNSDPDVLFVKPKHLNDRDLINARRTGLLIWETPSNILDMFSTIYMRGAYLEFHKTVFLLEGSKKEDYALLHEVRRVMFPGFPKQANRKLPKEAHSVIFRTIHLDNASFLKDYLYSEQLQTKNPRSG
jgi:hypothetical protein